MNVRIRPTHRSRRGMTLVEVIVSLAILGTATLSLGAFTGRMSRASSLAHISESAMQLVSERMDVVRAAPRYVAIESLYVATEPAIGEFSRYARRTMVRHVGGAPSDTIDYRIVTVEVTHPELSSPVRRTTIIAPF